MTLSLTKRTSFLIGMLLGVFLAYCLSKHVIEKAYSQARIEAVIVSEEVYKQASTSTFIIKNVPSVYPTVNKDLKIVLLNPEAVLKVYRERYPWDKTSEVFGFYDTVRNEIWCPNDTATLIHELRHVFEGDYHQ